MNKIPKFFVSALICFSFVSCLHQRPFVATGLEPLLVKKKGDIQVGAGMRPLRYLNINATTAFSDMFALRVGGGGANRMNAFEASAIFYKNYEKFGFYLGAGASYQRNLIRGKMPRKLYRYDCEYYSPDLIAGINLGQANSRLFSQLILKLQYNQVEKYYYEFYQNNGSSRSGEFQIMDNEKLTQKISPFLSLEFSYALIQKIGDFAYFKVQPGFLILQKTFEHEYQFQSNDRMPVTMAKKISYHPQALNFNASIGFVFKFNILRNQTEPVQP